MGIQGLAKVVDEHAPTAVQTKEMKAYFGRRIAIDASMSMYQFLIAVRQDGSQLTDENGETTSHLNGMFYRTIRMMEYGIKPVFVFDGKPPDLKAGELDKRVERRADAEKQLTEAREKGDAIAIEKFERRLVKVTKEHTENCKKLLRLMGVPVVEAPCEAEAQCAELVRSEKVFATATEDMDALTFGSNILTRRMTFSEAKKLPIQAIFTKEFNLEKVLRGFDMTMDQFIDFCILLGCDYCPTIRGVGPKKAFDLIIQHKSIESILEQLDTEKYIVPEDWAFKAARQLFLYPDVTKGDALELTWTDPKDDDLVKFMCQEKGFSEDRIRSALERLKKSRKAATQGRIDGFFKATATVSSEPSSKKRKAEEDKKAKTAAGAGGAKRKFAKKMAK